MKKSTKYGILGSVISCVIVLLLLFFLVFPGPQAPEKDDEGIIVSFGEKYDGSGMSKIPAANPSKTETPVKKTQPVKQELMTQTDKSVAIAEQKQKKKQQEQIERLRLENEKKHAEEKRKEQEAIDKANGLNGMFGNNNSTGKGTGSGESQQGNPVGKGNSNGNDWSLEGRELIGKLVKPKYNSSTIGKVTVSIIVDVNGHVIDASISRPTTISDADIRTDALKAARETQFSNGKDKAIGKITYNYINN